VGIYPAAVMLVNVNQMVRSARGRLTQPFAPLGAAGR
jgi:hypothetical protein